MSAQTVTPRPSRFFLDPAAHEDGGLPVGVCLMQALGVVIVTVLGFAPAFVVVLGFAGASLA